MRWVKTQVKPPSVKEEKQLPLPLSSSLRYQNFSLSEKAFTHTRLSEVPSGRQSSAVPAQRAKGLEVTELPRHYWGIRDEHNGVTRGKSMLFSFSMVDGSSSGQSWVFSASNPRRFSVDPD